MLCKTFLTDEPVILIGVLAVAGFTSFSFGFIAYFNQKEYFKSIFINNFGKEVIPLEYIMVDLETGSPDKQIVPEFYLKIKCLTEQNKIKLIEINNFRRDYKRKYDI